MTSIHRWMCTGFPSGTYEKTTLETAKCSFFVFSLVYLFRLCQCRVTSDFALVSGAIGVGHLCPPYLGTSTQPVRGVGVLGARQT